MMGMSIPYEATGRTQQKLRTRRALIDAARALIAGGATPTVEEAALLRMQHEKLQAYKFKKGRGCLHCRETGYSGRKEYVTHAVEGKCKLVQIANA